MILVAEDNDVNQMVIEFTLEGAGLAHTIVANGRLAVQQFQSIRPDLILMDISMPEMNGYEATQAIRELEQAMGGHTPIIALTAHALNGDSDKCFEAGMDDYMSKPISPDALTEKIRGWLAGSEARQRA
ncbi:MAG: response regulator [Pseudomonadota bacterium]